MPFYAIPAALKALRQWVSWRIEVREGKPTKVPLNPRTGNLASSTEAKTWGTFAEAESTGAVGFVFTPFDEFVGVDLDGCIDQTTGEPGAWAVELMGQFGTYAERSPSGTGVHLIVRGAWGNRWHKKTLPAEYRAFGIEKAAAIEVYDRSRYFTFTGDVLPGYETISEGQAELDRLHGKFAPKPASQVATRTSVNGTSGDHEILTVMFGRDDVRRLYHGDLAAYHGDDSAADLGLCNHLAYYTHGDLAQMDRLFRSSLLMREKWDSPRPGGTYGSQTIAKAIATQRSSFSPPAERIIFNRNGNHERPPHPADEVPIAEEKPKAWATAPILLAKTIPPLEWIVPGVIPTGLTILAGRPKQGKSWGVYGIGLAVASGGMAFGKIKVRQGAVLYLALEDSERRLQERMRSLLKGEPAPKDFHWAIQWPKLAAPGQIPTPEHPDCLMLIRRWLDETENPRLVMLDTLARVKPKAAKGSNAYEEDTEAMAPLQALTMERGLGLIALTHTRKPPSGKVSSDFLDEVQGSTGITGIADTILGLKKTGEQEVSLFTRGRDVEERELLIRWDELTSDWLLLGDAEQLRLSPLQKQCVQVLRKADGMLHYRAVAHALGREGISAEDSVGVLLRRLADREVVKQAEGGFFWVLPD